MEKTKALIKSCLILILIASTTLSQKEKKKVNQECLQSDMKLLDVSDSKSNGLKFENDRDLEIKVTSRKSHYRLDEIITLDVAILNKAKEPLIIFSPSKHNLEFVVKDKNDKPIIVSDFLVDQLGYSSNFFTKIQPNDYGEGNQTALIGCNLQDAYVKKLVDRKNSLFESPQIQRKTLFYEDYFVSWGDVCIDIREVGEYKIFVKLKKSPYVGIFPKCKSKIKTFIGTLESKPLTINIGS